jgi:mono/diheme cytochrome c family protein
MKKTTLIILMATSMGAVYAEGNHKGGHGAGAHWMSPAEASEKPNPIKRDAASIDRGKKSYFQYCSSCHGAKAMGDGPAAAGLNPKPTNLVAMSGGHPDGDFAWKIANGRGAMPAWKSVLNESQTWDLVNYIQNLNPKGKMMDMSKMDHSKMSADDMKKMMSSMGHSDADGHHDAPKKKVESHHDDGEKGHSH